MQQRLDPQGPLPAHVARGRLPRARQCVAGL